MCMCEVRGVSRELSELRSRVKYGSIGAACQFLRIFPLRITEFTVLHIFTAFYLSVIFETILQRR